MILSAARSHLKFAAALSGVASLLAACATTAPPPPKTIAVVPAPPPPQTQAPPVAEMAPIPNPGTDAHASVSSARPSKSTSEAHGTNRQASETPPADPSRAASLREVALVQLNRGAVAKAVALLQQANRLDPSNALIHKDLERALRISELVTAKQ